MLGTVLLALALGSTAWGCQLPSDWRPLSESCRAELAEIIVFAKVLAVHQDTYPAYNHLPWHYEAGDGGLFYSAEIEMLCDQAWGSMLEVPAGSRLNLTGLGYFSCHSNTVMQGQAYFFFLRMDENYSLLPHGVNFQEAIFADTLENRQMFSSLFQFSSCTQGQQLTALSPDWAVQEDNRIPFIQEDQEKPEIWENTTSMQHAAVYVIVFNCILNMGVKKAIITTESSLNKSKHNSDVSQ